MLIRIPDNARQAEIAQRLGIAFHAHDRLANELDAWNHALADAEDHLRSMAVDSLAADLTGCDSEVLAIRHAIERVAAAQAQQRHLLVQLTQATETLDAVSAEARAVGLITGDHPHE